MTSRSTAKKMVRPASKPVSKSAPKKPQAKLAKVTKFPTASVKKPLPAAKKSSPPPPAAQHRKSEPPPRGMPALTPPKQVQEPKQSLARSFYWSELRVGDDLPPLTKLPFSGPRARGVVAALRAGGLSALPKWGLRA